MSKTIEIKIPDIGGFDDVPVIEVMVKPGDTVQAEDSLITLESDKATMDVPSPVAGIIKSIKVKVGDKVAEGTLIALLEISESADATNLNSGRTSEASRDSSSSRGSRLDPIGEAATTSPTTPIPPPNPPPRGEGKGGVRRSRYPQRPSRRCAPLVVFPRGLRPRRGRAKK